MAFWPQEGRNKDKASGGSRIAFERALVYVPAHDQVLGLSEFYRGRNHELGRELGILCIYLTMVSDHRVHGLAQDRGRD